VGKDAVSSLLMLHLLILSLLTAAYFLPHTRVACYPSVNHVLVSRFPELSNYVDLSNYSVVSSNLNYTDLKILVFKWFSRGTSVEVQVVEDTCEIIRFEVIVDARYVNESGLEDFLSELEAGVKEWYSESKSFVGNTSRAEVLGGQVVVGDAPIYFLDPNYITVTPVIVRYFIYPSPPVVIYAFTNYFPAVKKLLTQIPNFSLSEEEAAEILKNKLNITEYRGLTKSYVILYGALRPAYIVAVTPYKYVAILADNGEILTQKTATNTQVTPESNRVITYFGLVLVLAAIAVIATYTVWLRKHSS